jgi:hypothetical protein
VDQFLSQSQFAHTLSLSFSFFSLSLSALPAFLFLNFLARPAVVCSLFFDLHSYTELTCGCSFFFSFASFSSLSDSIIGGHRSVVLARLRRSVRAPAFLLVPAGSCDSTIAL